MPPDDDAAFVLPDCAPGMTPEQLLEMLPGPSGPEAFGIMGAQSPQPAESPEPPYSVGDYLDMTERASGLLDVDVLCNRCTHGWIMAERAPTKNRKPDGSPFVRIKGYCTRYGQMPLSEMRPIYCTRFEDCGEVHLPPGVTQTAASDETPEPKV